MSSGWRFSGKFRSVGGSVSGYSNNAGAAGTVYKYESRRGPQYRELKYNPDANLTSFKPQHAKVKVDNENNNVATPTVIMENQTVFYEFDEMQVEGMISQILFKCYLGNAKLLFLVTQSICQLIKVVHKFGGDCS